MPQFSYRGRDKEGRLKTGQRFAFTADNLNSELIKEGISPIEIKETIIERGYLDKIYALFQTQSVHLAELAIFTRQIQLLYDAGVPMVLALRQLAAHTRSYKLSYALNGIIEHLEKGESLATGMRYYPEVFTPLMMNIVQIGENTGHLSEAFAHLHEYIEFEVSTIKQVRTAFRYPIFVVGAIIFAIIVLNIFVIPTFARFYTGLDVTLPWQTRFLIGMSNFTVHYGLYLLILIIAGLFYFYRYIKTENGKYRWHKFLLHLPIFGKLIRRIMLIRFSQSLAIILKSGLSVTQGLGLVKNVIANSYIAKQVTETQEAIERGIPFTQSISKIELFSPMEIQILAVGEKNGELSPALDYISDFHSNEIAFDLKRMNDFIGPVLISAISALILIVALGVYLPIWNMINLIHS